MPPTLALYTNGNAGLPDIMASTVMPAGLKGAGLHSSILLVTARHGINGNINVAVLTPAVASVYTIDVLLLGITC